MIRLQQKVDYLAITGHQIFLSNVLLDDNPPETLL